MNLFKILLDNGYTQRDKLNVERNWFGCDTYNLDNVYYKGDITIWIGLQWYGMPLPKQKKDWDLYDRQGCKFIRISKGTSVFNDKNPIFETWCGDIPNKNIIKELI